MAKKRPPPPDLIESSRPKLRRRGAPKKPNAKSTRPGKSIMAPLTDEEELFVARYMVRMNATRAYQDGHVGLSILTCRSEGSRMRNRPNVSQQIKALVEDSKKRLKRSSNRVLDETAAMAFSSLSDVFDGSGTIIPPNDLPRDVAVAVKEVKRQEILGAMDQETGQRKILGHTVELKMHDKIGPLKLLGQHFGVFKENIEFSGKDFASILKEARERDSDRSPTPAK